MRRHLALNTVTATRLLCGKGCGRAEIHAVDISVASRIAPRDGVIETIGRPMEDGVGGSLAGETRGEIPKQFAGPDIVDDAVEEFRHLPPLSSAANRGPAHGKEATPPLSAGGIAIVVATRPIK